MTKSEPIDVLYGRFAVQLNKPATVEEFDNSVGEAGAALESGISDVFYRNTLPRLYKEVVAKLGIAKKQAVDAKGQPITRKTGKGEAEKDVEVKESDIVAIDRAIREGDVTEDDARSAFESAADAIAFYVKGAGGGGKISEAALTSANGIIAQGEENIEEKVGIIESRVPGYKVNRDNDGAVSAEALARGIMALQKHLQAEAARNAKQALGV